VLRSASVMRPGHFFLLALLIGFLSYRAALATFPSERMWAQTPEGRVDTHFDAVTGIMVSPPAYAYPESGMYAHWFRSAMFGFAVVPLSFIALWWLARRRRADRQRRPDALSGITTTLALALCLVGCAGEPRLLRGEMTTCGWIGPWPWVSGVLLSGPVKWNGHKGGRHWVGVPLATHREHRARRVDRGCFRSLVDRGRGRDKELGRHGCRKDGNEGQHCTPGPDRG
jgi:hypothetical protein